MLIPLTEFKGSELRKRKREILIYSCFDLSGEVFRQQQTYNIILEVGWASFTTNIGEQYLNAHTLGNSWGKGYRIREEEYRYAVSV